MIAEACAATAPLDLEPIAKAITTLGGFAFLGFVVWVLFR